MTGISLVRDVVSCFLPASIVPPTARTGGPDAIVPAGIASLLPALGSNPIVVAGKVFS